MAGYGGKDGGYGGKDDGYGGKKPDAPGAPVPYGTPVDPPGAPVPYGTPVDAPAAPVPYPIPVVPYPDAVPGTYPPAVVPAGSSTYPPAVGPAGSSIPYPPAVGPAGSSIPYPPAVGPAGSSIPYPPAVGPAGSSNPYPPAVGPYPPVPYPPDPAKMAEEISKLKEKLAAADSKLGGAAGDKSVVEDAIKMYQEGLQGAGQAKSEFQDSEGLKELVNQFTTGLEAARAKLDKADSPSRSPKPVWCACALEHFECAKCFAPLHSKPLSVFIGSDGKRSCKHFIHTQCCDTASMKTCPTCDVAFASLKPVPSVADDPKGWFAAVDTDGNGTLDKEEAFAALASSLPVAPGTLDKTSTEALKKKVEEKWRQWDPDGDGKITCAEGMVAVSGLRDFVVEKLKEAAPKPGDVYALPPPPLPAELPGRVAKDEYNAYKAQKEAWYQHWDKDKSNSLDKEEVVRAIVKTFDLSSALSAIQGIREYLEDVWCIWDSNGDNVIDLEEFMQPQIGLGDSLIAALTHLLPKRS